MIENVSVAIMIENVSVATNQGKVSVAVILPQISIYIFQLIVVRAVKPYCWSELFPGQ